MTEIRTYTPAQKLGADALGTFWLVLGGCGTAIFAATAIPEGAQMAVGVGWLGVALAFGLTVLTGVYAFGHISGGHLISVPISNTSVNPARSLGVAWCAGEDALAQVWVFILAPVLGAAIAGLLNALMLDPDDD